jgi:ATP-dependent DNA helicase RecG
VTVEDLLHGEEGKTLEFKRDLSSPKKLLKTLVAFANTAGGTVIVGVDDTTRHPLGLEQPLDEEERLCSLIADSISPRLVPDVEMITVEGKTLLVWWSRYF